MKLYRQAAVISTICSIPFTSLASFAWYQAEKGIARGMNYEAGDALYFLGAPLTLIPYYTDWKFQDSDNWWATPVMNALFALQWIIWGQLVAFLCNWVPPSARK